MSRPRRARAARGFTLLEVMVAGAVLLIAVLGFVGVVRYAATANAVANRRTSLTYFRAALMDRLAVTPRLSLTGGGVPASTWVVDSCWDQNGQLVGSNLPSSSGYSSSYTCPGTALYQSWLYVTPVSASSVNAGSNCATAGSCVQVKLYVERTDMSCTDTSDATRAKRYSSTGCVAADLLFTD
ncbi:type IV pilus modification PilV family protein [Anaeromyxobacter paludicola]|uniref:Prepilin-type N-terminal cleavage/methylation domain-containing protein n=1 Tax=Anaeromyxobacter paludicola TaxID=2918171 RepID=A0ABN6N796_9BACT|nr:prepilin-type N-terminal cleavage/methylation domain-containing protein [Anaeromyxobacter paludicola]BDG09041.1 hypothetical protein AMPC_21540 [Anaeromyxobacter paludicola]